MYPNLEAEQARHGHTNEYVANKLNLKRKTFEYKKSVGTFKLPEIQQLLKMYNAPLEYLFNAEPLTIHPTPQEESA